MVTGCVVATGLSPPNEGIVGLADSAWVTGKITSRLIYAVIIFLVPTIVTLLFSILGNSNATIKSDTSSGIAGDSDCTWEYVWKNAGKTDNELTNNIDK